MGCSMALKAAQDVGKLEVAGDCKRNRCQVHLIQQSSHIRVVLLDILNNCDDQQFF
jgi:hypothetical protein